MKYVGFHVKSAGFHEIQKYELLGDHQFHHSKLSFMRADCIISFNIVSKQTDSVPWKLPANCNCSRLDFYCN